MKKWIWLAVFVLIFTMMAAPALAAGKMTVTQENFYVDDEYGVNAYLFAKVENTGDRAVEYSAGLWEIYDKNGDPLTSNDWLGCYPSCLAPGETGYVYASAYIEEAESAEDADDYMLTVTGKSSDQTVTYYPCQGEYQPDVQVSEYYTQDFVTAEITNDTQETVFGMEVVAALMDEEGNLLYVEHTDFYDSTGINAGSTVTYRFSLSDSWPEIWDKAGVTPAKVEVLAYTIQD